MSGKLSITIGFFGYFEELVEAEDVRPPTTPLPVNAQNPRIRKDAENSAGGCWGYLAVLDERGRIEDRKTENIVKCDYGMLGMRRVNHPPLFVFV